MLQHSHDISGVRYSAKRNLFSDDVVRGEVRQGATIGEMIAGAGLHRLPGVHLKVWLNHHIEISPAKWETFTPAEGDHVSILQVPTGGGGGGGGKNPMATVLQLAVVAAAIYVPTLPAFSAGMTFSGAAYGSVTLGAGSLAGMGWAASMGILMVGSYMVNMIAPPPTPAMSGMTGFGSTNQTTSNTYSITGARNQANKYGVLPIIFGTHRIWPFYGATPYTENVGDDQYLRMLFDIGHGHIALSDFKIGETPLDEYDDVEMVVHDGTQVGNDLEIYTTDIHQEALSIELTNEDGWRTQYTELDIEAFNFDLTASRLFKLSGSEYVSTLVTFEAQVRPVGGSDDDWESAFGKNVDVSVESIEWQIGPLVTSYQSVWTTDSEGRRRQDTRAVKVRQASNKVRYYLPAGTVVDDVISGGTITITGSTNDVHNGTFNVLAMNKGEAPYIDVTNPAVSDDSYDEETTSATSHVTSSSQQTITDNKTSEVRRTFGRNVETGQYEIRIRRLTADDDTDKVYDAFSWTTLRSIKFTSPSAWKVPVCQVELRIKASGQLNGVIDQFNMMASAYHPVYDSDTGTWSEEITSNPAWHMLDVLRGVANKKAIGDSRIHLDSFVAFAERCDEQGWAFDHVVDYASTVDKMLGTIAGAGRASRGMYDSKHAVVMDMPQTVERGHITPRNSWGYKGKILFPDQPHAYRVRFTNKEAGYQADERIVYADGYDEDTATNYETLEVVGKVDPDEVWLAGRYHIATAKLRPELHEVWQDFEHLLLKRGDMFIFQEDVPMLGVGTSARVREALSVYSSSVEAMGTERKFVSTNSDEFRGLDVGDSLVVSGFANEENNGLFAIAAKASNSSITVDRDLVDESAGETISMSGGDVYHIICDDTFPLTAGHDYVARIRTALNASVQASFTPTETGNQAIMTFSNAGGAGTDVAEDDLVSVFEAEKEATEMIVVGIEHGEDLTAKLYFQAHAPAVHTPGEWVPDWDSQITKSPNYDSLPPPKPAFADVVSDESVLIMGPDGTLTSRIVAGFVWDSGAAWDGRVEFQAQYKPSDGTSWTPLPTMSQDERQFIVMPVQDGVNYDLRIRTVSLAGNTSVWTVLAGHPVIGKTSPPPDVPTLMHEDGFMVWAYNDRPLDFAGFEVRYRPGLHVTWATAERAHKEELIAEQRFDLSKFSGLTSFLVCAVDTGGRPSSTPAILVKDMGDPAVDNIVETYDFAPGLVASDSTQMWADDESTPMWSDDEGTPMWSNSFDALEYEFSVTIPEILAGSSMTMDLDGDGVGLMVQYRTEGDTPMWHPSESTPMWADDESAAMWTAPPDWKLWPGRIEAVEARRYYFRISYSAGTTQAHIDTVDVVIDVPDIVEDVADVAITTDGTRISLAKGFGTVKTIQITMQENGLGASRVDIVDKNAEAGPMLRAVGAEALVDVRVAGHR